MKETIRCCISCILPCGVLDVVRIVHANGRVEEIGHAVLAADVMRAYPKHVLRKPPSAAEDGGGRAVVVPPNAELQRGMIYFLMPVSAAAPEKPRTAKRRRKKKESDGVSSDRTRLLVSDRYLEEILSEKVSIQRDHRRGRAAVWRPHLESISEVASDI